MIMVMMTVTRSDHGRELQVHRRAAENHPTGPLR